MNEVAINQKKKYKQRQSQREREKEKKVESSEVNCIIVSRSHLYF